MRVLVHSVPVFHRSATPTWTNACTHTSLHTHNLTHSHAFTRSHTRLHTWMHTHTLAHTSLHAHNLTPSHACTHSRAHTYAHRHAHSHTHHYTHTHTQANRPTTTSQHHPDVPLNGFHNLSCQTYVITRVRACMCSTRASYRSVAQTPIKRESWAQRL